MADMRRPDRILATMPFETIGSPAALGRLHRLRAGHAGRRPRRLPPQGPRGEPEGGRRPGARSGSPWRWSSTPASTSGSARERALEFTTGYLIEKALAVDNIFVFVVIFSAFAIPAIYQHRVLFWGVLGALVMRAVFILAGGALLQRFHWTIYLFGAILVITGVKLLVQRNQELHPERNPLVRAFQRLFPVTTELRRRPVHRGARRPPLRHPAAPRPGGGRGDRPGLRGRLHPRHLRRHHGPVHRLHLEHLRHPRPALALLPAGRASSPGSST